MENSVQAAPETLVKESTDLVVQARGVGAIETAEHYTHAVMIGKALRSMNKGILEFWKPLVENAHRAHKALCVRRDEMTKPVDGAIEVVDGKIGVYLKREEDRRAAAERDAREAALKAEQDRALAEASHLSELGLVAEANTVLEEAITAPAPAVIMPSSVPKIAGVSQRQTWHYRIMNEALIPREYLTVDNVKLNQVVRALKNQTKIPGIEVYPIAAAAMRS